MEITLLATFFAVFLASMLRAFFLAVLAIRAFLSSRYCSAFDFSLAIVFILYLMKYLPKTSQHNNSILIHLHLFYKT